MKTMSLSGRNGLATFWELEELGRIQLSKSFCLRDFLHSEIAAFHRLPNVPVDRDLLVETGTRLCEMILEPLQDTFGRIHVRSGYRSPSLNAFGFENGLKCSRNDYSFADHIWDVRDGEGNAGACACIVIPWFLNTHTSADWQKLAWWLYDHIDFHRVVFFSRQLSFNIGWRENPRREISSYLQPKGQLIWPSMAPPADRAQTYAHFPPFRGAKSPVSA